MKKNVKKYSLLIIAAVLLAALAFAGATSALEPYTDSTVKLWVNESTDTGIHFHLNESKTLDEVKAIYNSSATGYKITSADDLLSIGSGSDIYILTQDIYFTELRDSAVIRTFTGTLIGNGYTIYNLTINNVSGTGNQGLVANMGDHSTLNYVNLTCANISAGNKWAGGLAGIAMQAGSTNITGCNVAHSEITARQRVGGLVGYAQSNGLVAIHNCSVENCSIISLGTDCAGGLVGSGNGNLFIRNCYVRNCSISASTYGAGGLIGTASGANVNVEYCNATNCIVSATRATGDGSYVGGLAGFALGSANFEYCNALNCTVLSTVNGGGVGGLVGYPTGSLNGCSAINCLVAGNATSVKELIGFGSPTGTFTATNVIVDNTSVDTAAYQVNISRIGEGSSTEWHATDGKLMPAVTSPQTFFNTLESGKTYGYAYKSFDNRTPSNYVTVLGVYGKENGYGYYPTYTVIYNGNGNESGSVPVDATRYTADAEVTVLGNIGDLAKIGYDFGGWAVGSPAGEVINPGDTFTITEDVTLYANWTNGPVLLTGSDLSTYNVLVVDEVTGAVSTKHPSELIDNVAKDVYLLKNAAHWDAVALDEETYNGTVLILDADLDFSTTADDYMMIYRFNGSIYGNGKVIKNFTNISNVGNNIGLIQQAGDGLYLNYVQTNNCSLKTTGQNLGLLVGSVPAGCNTVQIIGCSISGGDLNASSHNVGALNGAVFGGELTVKFSNAENVALHGNYDVAGLVGGSVDGTTVTIYGSNVSNCQIFGTNYDAGLFGGAYTGAVVNLNNCMVTNSTIIGIKTDSACIASLIGGIDSAIITISDCDASNCTVNGASSIGGLLGLVYNTNENLQMSNCNAFEINVSTKGNGGGLIGRISESNITMLNCSEINCQVNGITGDLGGLVGYAVSSSTKEIVVMDCYAINTTITGYNNNVGGLVGNMKNNAHINNCYVTGKINGSSNVGGAVGSLGSSAEIKNCLVLTEMCSATSSYGRLVGSAAGTISNCYAWEGMLVNGVTVSGGALDNKDGLNVSSFDFWNKQSFFENTLGWDFDNVWKMNDGNDKCRLPVLTWQTTPVSGDASYLIPSSSVVADANNVATFGNNNASIVRDTAVDSIVLESVNNVTGTVKFTVDNTSVSSVLPSISGMNAPITVSIFGITADNDGSGTKSTIYLNVTFSNLADKDKVRFFHYTDGSGWDAMPLTSSIVAEYTSENTVLYMVETNSFSPFGIGIYTAAPQQYTPSSSKQTGSTVILQEGQVAPTASATATPTVAPTAEPTPANPTVIATEKPTTQATQQSPAPFLGIIAGLGVAAVLLRLRK